MAETTGAPASGTGAITTGAKLIHGPRAGLGRIQAALLSRPHGGYDDGAIRYIARLYTTTAAPVGLDPLLCVAQMRVETGNLTSPWSQPPHHNPAGIGVTGQPGAGVDFPSWAFSVRAHVGRLLAYAMPIGSENDLQKLLIDEALHWRPLPDSNRGVAPTLRGLVGTWATDPNYAKTIARVANEIDGSDMHVAPTPPEPDPVDNAGAPEIVTARFLGLTFRNLFGELGPELNVTGHYSATPRARDKAAGIAAARSFHQDHMNKGWGGIGYHYVIPDDGTLICARPTILKGTHVYLHNSNNIGVNMPGTTGDKPTQRQAQTFRWLLANAHTAALPAAHRSDRDLRDAHLRGHKQWPDQSTACPGLFLSMYLAGGHLGGPAAGGPEDVAEPEPPPPEPEVFGGVEADFINVSPEEAAGAGDPAEVDPWLPPPDPRFDGEAPVG